MYEALTNLLKELGPMQNLVEMAMRKKNPKTSVKPYDFEL